MSVEREAVPPPHLEAGRGLRFEPGARDTWRIRWQGADWWGPVSLGLGAEPVGARPAGALPFAGQDASGPYRGLELSWQDLPHPLRATVRAYDRLPLLVFRLEAPEGAEGLATGDFARPAVAWPWLRPALRGPGAAPPGLRAYGHQYTEFAFPTFGDADASDWLLFPHRPAVVMPLWLNAADGSSMLLAPLDRFHEQVVAVPDGSQAPEPGIRCGWHGDLAGVPAGFSSEIALWAGPGPRAVLESWAARLREAHGTRRVSRYEGAALARLSYWTDNGATYWYRTEPELDVATTLERVHRSLREERIPIGSWELDSWFYPHEVPRAISSANPEHVPPSGALLWEPREDALPDGILALRERLGDKPLILHARHFSGRSPYWETEPAWRDGERAHPQDPGFFDRLISQAAGWGAETLEQDWLVEVFLGVRGLRERPGRARAWQRGLDRAAAEHGMTLLWCMATPADFLASVQLGRLGAIRTCGDYRYLAPNPANWVRFLYTNALARALGLHPFKDVFLSNPDGAGMDGDPHAEAEAMLSALSAGPVGLGDRLGCTRRDVVLRTCREDGVLVKPDVPLAAIDRCLRRDCFFEPELLVAECWNDHPAGRWVYVVAMNAWRGQAELTADVPLPELGAAAPRGPVLAFDWRTGDHARLEPGGSLPFRARQGDWTLSVLCPLLCGERIALFGDIGCYASVGDRRLRRIRSGNDLVRMDVLGAPGERVEIRGWSASGATAELAPREGAAAETVRSAPAGDFVVEVPVGRSGWTHLRLAPR